MTRPPSYQKYRLVSRNPRLAYLPDTAEHPMANRLAKMKPSEIETLASAIANLAFTNTNARLDEIIGVMRQMSNEWSIERRLTERLSECVQCGLKKSAA
jgi:hypothetical protein